MSTPLALIHSLNVRVKSKFYHVDFMQIRCAQQVYDKQRRIHACWEI